MPINKVSFSNPDPDAKIVPAFTQNQHRFFEEEGETGEPLAQLNLKHAVDRRFGDVTPGHFVYSHSVKDYLPLTPPFRVIFLGARKRYLQNVEADETPLICDTEREIKDFGGTLDPGRPELISFSPFCDCLILIARESRSDWANTPLLIVGEEEKVLAAYRAKKSAYREIGSVLVRWSNYQKLTKKKPALLWVQEWDLSSTLREGRSFSYWAPTLRPAGQVTDSQAEALKELTANL
jgi:hypothetical protein